MLGVAKSTKQNSTRKASPVEVERNRDAFVRSTLQNESAFRDRYLKVVVFPDSKGFDICNWHLQVQFIFIRSVAGQEAEDNEKGIEPEWLESFTSPAVSAKVVHKVFDKVEAVSSRDSQSASSAFEARSD